MSIEISKKLEVNRSDFLRGGAVCVFVLKAYLSDNKLRQILLTILFTLSDLSIFFFHLITASLICNQFYFYNRASLEKMVQWAPGALLGPR